MALIKCEECGREISNKAKACIHCGCPISSDDSVNIVDSNGENKIIVKSSKNEFYDKNSQKLWVAFDAVVSNKSKESTFNHVYVKELDKTIEILVPNNIKENEQIWKKVDDTFKCEIVVFTVKNVSIDPSIESIAPEKRTKKKEAENKTVKDIMNAYKPNCISRFFDGPGVLRFIVLFLTFVFVKDLWIKEVLITIFIIEFLLILMKILYPFHHVKKYIRKKHIDDAIKNDPNYRNIAILTYNLRPCKRMLRYIKKLNVEAGVEIERQLNQK